MKRVAVLGAGPAGLGAALALARRGFDVALIEQRAEVGGNAGSFELDGLRVDYGSHRLHPAADPAILAELRALLGDDLLTRPRHGRIRLGGRWIHFPLRAGDLALRVPPRFAMGVGLDLVRRLLPRGAAGSETFASVLERGLGPTICREFYFPYARKIWGMEPDAISAAQARKRVASSSIGKMLRRLLPGGTGSGAGQSKGIFYYPRRGYGEISERLAEAAAAAGARLLLEAKVQRVSLGEGAHRIDLQQADGTRSLEADHVWSTIPITVLTRLLVPTAPPAVLEAAASLRFRAMLLVYLVVEQDRFTEYDAHYFPGGDVRITRLSEPKNYAAVAEPRGRTVLCAELPCDREDAVFGLPDEALGQRVREDLERAGLPLRAPIRRVVVRRLAQAYPLYPEGFEEPFDRIDAWLAKLARVLTFGRQGLYAHDNTHHALYMAAAASRCLRDDGSFDGEEWSREREVFATHVVED